MLSAKNCTVAMKRPKETDACHAASHNKTFHHPHTIQLDFLLLGIPRLSQFSLIACDSVTLLGEGVTGGETNGRERKCLFKP